MANMITDNADFGTDGSSGASEPWVAALEETPDTSDLWPEVGAAYKEMARGLILEATKIESTAKARAQAARNLGVLMKAERFLQIRCSNHGKSLSQQDVAELSRLKRNDIAVLLEYEQKLLAEARSLRELDQHDGS